MRYASWESDNGRTVVFDGAGPYYFGAVNSPLGATAETGRAPRQDGQTTYHVALDARTANLTGSMRILGDPAHPAMAEYDRARSFLCEAFAPNRWGWLTYYREDGAVRLRCRPVALPTISAPVGTYSTIDIDFAADSPCWERAEEAVVCIGLILRFWRFPWSPRLGPLGAFDRFAGVENPGVEVIYPTVEVYSTGQVVTLANRTTGQAATIEHPIAQGEKLVVDLRDVTAWLWRQDGAGDYRRAEDVSHWMSLDSQPWGLAPGYNQIVVSNEVPEDTPVAYVRYRLPVLGV